MEDQNKVEPNEVIQNEPVKVESIGSVEARPAEKKKVNGFAIFFGLTTLIFAGAAVFFGVEYFKNDQKTNTQVGPNTEITSPSETEEEITSATMADDYKEVRDLMDNVAAGVGDSNRGNVKNGSGLTYKPEWSNTFIPMRFDIEKEIVDQNYADFNAAESNMNTLKTKFENAGFTSLGILPYLGSAGPEIYGYLNSDTNIVCGMYGDAESGFGGTVSYYYVLLECAKTDWTWLTDADKALASELETAYYEKTGEYPVVLFVDADKSRIKDSQYKPYQTLMVSLGGGAGLFYRTSPEEKWQFFTGAQAAPGCDEYNTDDLKKAYLGETCYSDDGMVESTVRL